MADKKEKKEVKVLQGEIADLDIEKSKLTEKIHEINLKQQQNTTLIYEAIAEVYKNQASGKGNLLIPKGSEPSPFYGQN